MKIIKYDYGSPPNKIMDATIQAMIDKMTPRMLKAEKLGEASGVEIVLDLNNGKCTIKNCNNKELEKQITKILQG